MIAVYCLIILTLVAAIVACHQLVALGHAKRRFESRLIARENRANRQTMDAIEAEDRRALLRNSVDTGTSAVEFVHRAISTTTFELIDRFSKSERLRMNSRQARDVHDDASQGVYRSIRVANKHIHALANVIVRENRQRGRKAPKKDQPPEP